MNQILQTHDIINNYNNFELNRKNKKNYLFIFFFSVIICVSIIIYIFISYLSKLLENKKSDILKHKYEISSLYSNFSNNNYTALKLSNDISIIGLIEIPKIDISYPILSNSTTELLKISVCRFSGPYPNRAGNLCIAGHNYKNNMMFSNLQKLKINDSIFITDLNNVRIEYIVYKKFKVKENNLDCTQNTSDVQVTLITCNDNNNKERIVIKAKVKD